ncbi:response regulator transcription factor [Paraburkholderia tropica]|uniref:Winged helix family two component transcriptional regulator n=1 Tax=Paraburkholderia tropica TaxID=92647 RepID=A0ABX5MQF3_9BURK|nr:response regulator transcription factor [Paraburkholderia tropica]MDE1143703.1 response regulator transcription factor [Paraburkholderia tropica]PXX16919.1 winged helix family two component transcriptional regulator [Paraburkholderia tropica]PZW83938.1 winged helix family two component transcriptional regulator [Paraburkholderia tropica]
MPTVLVVEDDAKTRHEIQVALEDAGYTVETATTGADGLAQATSRQLDAIILDRMLPGGMEGLDVLGTLREAGSTTPVLILSALSTVDERVKGLRAGGDDYLVKPFEYIELTARLDSLVRRSQTASQEQAYRVGALNVDLVSRSVVYAGKEVELLPREYRILEYMIRREGQVISRTMLFEAVWNYRVGERTNVIDVHISRLRRKLDPTGSAPIIHTVRGSGYVLRAPD